MAAPKPVQLQDYPPPAYNDHLADNQDPFDDSHDLFADNNLPSNRRPNLSRAHSSSPLPDAAHYRIVSGIRSFFNDLFSSVYFWLAVICNLPLLLLAMVDIITTVAYPSSKLYRESLHTVDFERITVFICIITAGVNLCNMFFRLCTRHPRDRGPPSLPVLFTWFVLGCIFAPCWLHISAGMHDAVKPRWPSCGAEGYGASVSVSVEIGRGASNVTIVSAWDQNEVLGMQLTPTVLESRDLDFFRVRAAKGLSSRGVWSTVVGAGGLSADVGLETHRYGVSYNGSVSGGRIIDDRSFFLAFPDLGIKSGSKKAWSSWDREGRPVVNLVEDGDRTVLVTVDSEKKKNGEVNVNKDLVWNMCTKWSVAEMLADRKALEKVLAPLTRLGIEMQLWGTENHK